MLSAEAAHRVGVTLLRSMGKRALHKYAAIDLSSGAVHLGDTSLEAVDRGLSVNPKGQFQIERLGHRVAGKMRRR